MRALIALIVSLVLLSQAHWTQKREHVTLVVKGACFDLAESAVSGNSCEYINVTAEGSLTNQNITLTDVNGKSITINNDDIQLSATSSKVNNTGFTWRTYALFIVWLLIVIWSLLPELKLLNTWLRRSAATN